MIGLQSDDPLRTTGQLRRPASHSALLRVPPHQPSPM